MQAARPVALVLCAAHAHSAVRRAPRFVRVLTGASFALALVGSVEALRASASFADTPFANAGLGISAAAAQPAGKPAPDAVRPQVKPAVPVLTPKPAIPVAAAGAAVPKNTEPKPRTPAQVLAAAQKNFKSQNYAAALPDFQAAYATKESPEVARSIAVCLDKAGDVRAAHAFYTKFLAAVPKSMTKEGAEAKERADEIFAMGGHLSVSATPASATVVVDGKGEPTKLPANIDLAQGTHTLRFSAPDFVDAEKRVDVTFASAQTVTQELQAVPPPPPPPPVVEPPPPPVAVKPPPPPPPAPRNLLPAYITGGVAIAALGIGTGFGLRALSKKSDYDKAPSDDLANSGENAALVADMAFGVAITFGITSAVLFLTKDETDEEKPADADAKPADTKPADAKPGDAKPADAKTLDAKPTAWQPGVHRTSAPHRAARPFIVPMPLITPTSAGAGALIRF